jgi:hypothetical protein
VPKFEELSEKGRLVRKRFEDCLRTCLAGKICRKKFGLLTHHQFNPEETSLRPNSRNIKKLRKLLRQADCSTNPYLKWSRNELVTALVQRQVPTPWIQIMSRFACHMALEEADKHRTFQLMDLPDELRVMAYKRALLSEGPVIVKDNTKPALLLVSYQVRQEASPVFFQINEFELRVNEGGHEPNFSTAPWPDILAASSSQENKGQHRESPGYHGQVCCTMWLRQRRQTHHSRHRALGKCHVLVKIWRLDWHQVQEVQHRIKRDGQFDRLEQKSR